MLSTSAADSATAKETMDTIKMLSAAVIETGADTKTVDRNEGANYYESAAESNKSGTEAELVPLNVKDLATKNIPNDSETPTGTKTVDGNVGANDYESAADSNKSGTEAESVPFKVTDVATKNSANNSAVTANEKDKNFNQPSEFCDGETMTPSKESDAMEELIKKIKKCGT